MAQIWNCGSPTSSTRMVSSRSPRKNALQTLEPQHRPAQMALPLEPKRAQTPRPVAPTPALRQAQQRQSVYLQAREALERRSALRGLVLMALLALVVSLIRAGADRAFYAGWWGQW